MIGRYVIRRIDWRIHPPRDPNRSRQEFFAFDLYLFGLHIGLHHPGGPYWRLQFSIGHDELWQMRCRLCGLKFQDWHPRKRDEIPEACPQGRDCIRPGGWV